MPSKNIADKMTGLYNEIQKEKDIGKRLLNLIHLQNKLDQLIQPPKNKQDHGVSILSGVATVLAGAGVPIAAGVTLMATMADLGLGIAVLGGIAGGLGGFVGGVSLSEKIDRVKNINSKAAFAKKVAPYVVNLKSLHQEIQNDRKLILNGDNVEVLRQSSVLKDLLKVQPELINDFNKVSTAAPQTVKMVKAAELESDASKQKNLEL